MEVLYNGVLTEYDIQQNCNWQQITESVERNRSRVGQQIGDFVVTYADYDWGTLMQVNTVRCVRCGLDKSVVNQANFLRGKGEGRRCGCRYEKKETTQKVEYSDYIGQTVNGFRLLSYEIGKGFRTECTECGKQKWICGKAVLSGTEPCNHRVVAVYDDSVIGKKYGHLTAVERVGKHFRFRCDCGFEKVLRPTDVCRGMTTTCGRLECEYYRDTGMSQKIVGAQNRGFDFEQECAAEMENQGYKVEVTPHSGDCGVDFFAVVDGERVAFQCKKMQVASRLTAVQEVYAGGRYYDCSKFVVVSPSGFTYPAEQMAGKLGVQLERDLRDFRLKSLVENKIDTQKIRAYASRALQWEIDGVTKPVEQWCAEYGISRSAVTSRVKNGMDLKTALTARKHCVHRSRKAITIDGVTKTKVEWCDEYGISPQLYDYRIKYSGLSPLEALTREKAR